MLKRLSLILTILVILSVGLVGTSLAANDVQTAADGYFSSGTQNIKAADLFDILNDGDSENDPFILDVRQAVDYELAHIPGAVNMAVKTAFTADQLATIPTDKEVVVYCYTGQTSSQMVSALNMLGYQAKSMLFGFPAWAMVDGLTGQGPFDRAVDGHDYKVDEEATEATETFDLAPPLDATVSGAALAYFSNGTKNIKASAVFDNLNDGDTSNDPFILDVRKAEDYATAHIPGSVHIDPKVLFSDDNLSKIPADKQVVVYCYTGQTGSQVTSVLNMLGYDATNLKFGFAAWSSSGKYAFNAATDSPNYRFEGSGTAATTETTTEANTEANTTETPAETTTTTETVPTTETEQTPETLPQSGGVPLNYHWIYLLVGGVLLSSGILLYRR